MRFIPFRNSFYVVFGPRCHKSIETGYNADFSGGGGFDIDWRFRTKGDHAGLKFSFMVRKFLFEFNVYDDRHWNYRKDRWYEAGEELKETDENEEHQ